MEYDTIREGETELEAFNAASQYYNLVKDIERGCKYFWSKRGGDPAEKYNWNQRHNSYANRIAKTDLESQ